MGITSLVLNRTAVIFLAVELWRFPVVRCSLDIHEFDQRCIALFNVANYLVQRPQQMNVDGLFGITLAEANLIGALSHPNARLLSSQYFALMANILQLLDRARLHMKSTVVPENREVALIYRLRDIYFAVDSEVRDRALGAYMHDSTASPYARVLHARTPRRGDSTYYEGLNGGLKLGVPVNAILNEPNLWIRKIRWKRGALGMRPKPTAALNWTIAEKLIFRGTPQEKESDLCIGDLIRGLLEKRCKISEDCAEMLLREDEPAGYPLTHRLLYVQIARALNCQETQRVPIFKLIPIYCKEILQNLVDTEATKFPGVSRDLAIEQVLLCGMEGFMDFTNDHYAKLIRSWAHPAGCYNSRGFTDTQDNFNNLITRRSGGLMDFGCENHASGLAAGSLGLLVREHVENAFQTYDYDKNEKK